MGIEPGNQNLVAFSDQLRADLVAFMSISGMQLQQLNLEVTQRCNLTCTYCQHAHGGVCGVRRHTDLHMGLDVADAALALLDARGGPETAVSHYGGEPLLNLPLVRHVVEARPGHRHQVDTNGLLVTRELAEWSAGFDVGWQISLDGPPDLNDRYRGAGTAAAVLRAIDEIRRARADAPITISCTLAPPYELERRARWFDEALPDVHLVARLASLDGCPDLRPDALDVTSWRRRYVESCLAGEPEAIPRMVRQILEPPLQRLARHQVGPRARWIPGACCHPAVRRLHVMADGELRPCEKVAAGHRIGDVWTGVDWAAVDQLHEDFYARRMALGCQDCWAVRHCGTCWASPPPDCEGIRERLRVAMACYAEIITGGGSTPWKSD